MRILSFILCFCFSVSFAYAETPAILEKLQSSDSKVIILNDDVTNSITGMGYIEYRYGFEGMNKNDPNLLANQRMWRLDATFTGSTLGLFSNTGTIRIYTGSKDWQMNTQYEQNPILLYNPDASKNNYHPKYGYTNKGIWKYWSY